MLERVPGCDAGVAGFGEGLADLDEGPVASDLGGGFEGFAGRGAADALGSDEFHVDGDGAGELFACGFGLVADEQVGEEPSADREGDTEQREIGRASGRERVCRYV